MAPICTISSRKRSSTSQGDDGMDDPTNKKFRVESLETSCSTVSLLDNTVTTPSKPTIAIPEMFDDDPQQLLLRSIALALRHVGFTAATPEALEAMRSQVETYAEHFLSKVTSSMANSRRPLPTPLDFQYALDVFRLPIASIEPHLRPPIAKSQSLIQLESRPPDEQPVSTNIALVGKDLDGDLDKKSRPYIPRQFPPFPSKHTYKWTEKESARETDPRKIREEAAKAARQGEEALRRLANVGKAGKEKDMKKTASRDPKCKERHEIWEKTMSGFLFPDNESSNTITVVSNDEEASRGTIVNAERSFFRKGPPTRRRPPPVAEHETVR